MSEVTLMYIYHGGRAAHLLLRLLVFERPPRLLLRLPLMRALCQDFGVRVCGNPSGVAVPPDASPV